MEASTYQPPRYISSADQAKMLRAALKTAFPGVKFSVRCSRGSAIHVDWTDGPTPAQVEQVTNLYVGGGFDGMQDLRYNVQTMISTDEGAEVVQFMSDFIFTQREISDEWRRDVFALFSRCIGRELDPAEDASWGERVPLHVSHDGTLYRMVDTETDYLPDVFHRFVHRREGGNVQMTAEVRDC